MDELRIRSKFMRTMVSKLLAVAIKKKFGYKIDIQIAEIEVTFIDERAHIHLNADAEMNSTELKKITKVIGLEEET